MKKTVAAFSIIAILSLAVGQKSNDSVTEAFRTIYFDDFDQFRQEVTSLSQVAANTTFDDDILLLQRQLTKTRLAYKKIEYVFDYYDFQYVYMNINGGPLPKIDKENARSDIVEPNGLQTLDELIFCDQPFEEIKTITKLSSQLDKAVKFIAPTHTGINLGEKQIIEALRTGIVRLFTLGLTGFDTPGSVNALEEARSTMRAMQKGFQCFEKKDHPQAEKSFKAILQLYEVGLQLLEEQKDFNHFDRLQFLTQIVNPLYKTLKTFRQQQQLDANRFRYHAQNYEATNLFEPEFLDTDYYSQFTYNPFDNPEAIELGRTLFFDPSLSRNYNMACSSCHNPALAFTDGLPQSKTSKANKYTKRNSPTLTNAPYSSRFFWDLREYDLERQVAHVIEDSLEFNINFNDLVKRLRNNPLYQKRFEKAYQGIAKNDINRRSISNAIGAYVNSLKAMNSQFDRYVRSEQPNYPENAKRGFNLFMGKAACGTCHFAPVFNGNVPPFYLEAESEVLGVTMGFDTLNPILDKDLGRGANGLHEENYPHLNNSFKTVTVRNAAITGPYMHNGSFKTLEEVMEFYNRGGGAGMGLEVTHQTLAPDPLDLTTEEQNDIIAFLNTLTDTTSLKSEINYQADVQKRLED